MCDFLTYSITLENDDDLCETSQLRGLYVVRSGRVFDMGLSTLSVFYGLM